MRHHRRGNWRLLLLPSVAALAVIFPSLVGGGNDREAFREGEMIVGLQPGADINAFNAQFGTTTVDRIEGAEQYLVRLPPGAEVELEVEDAVADDRVLFAGPNYHFQAAEVRQHSQAYIDQHSQAYIDNSSPANFFAQPSTQSLHLVEAQRYSRGFGVRVAVIDTGIDPSHPLFAGRIGTPVYDFVGNDVDPREEAPGVGYGHGTFVAGLVALAAPGAVLLPLRAFGPDGSGTSFNIARAIRFAADAEAQVINLSFGLLVEDPLIKDALDYAYSKSYMVAAAGNDDRELIHFPASRESKALSVTAVDAADHKAAFANYHANMQVAAPGVDLYSAYPEGRWATWSGTSFATALVSGEAALLLSLDKGLNRSALNRIATTAGVGLNAANPGYLDQLGSVRVDFLSAVQAIGPKLYSRPLRVSTGPRVVYR